jgi:hypothetical protein
MNVLVHQMGKVGATTVMEAIRSIGWEADRSGSWNIHTIDKSRYDRIISMVRDPIGRNISQLFSEWEEHLGYFPEKYDPSQFEIFKTQFPHEWPLEWFDKWMWTEFNIDVFREPFNKKRHWQIYDDKLLIIRTENLSQVIRDALTEFLGLPWDIVMDTRHRNLGETSRGEAHGEAYAEFKRNAKFDAAFLDKMYNSKYARHFYTDNEIQSFKERWSL